jgi:predicted Zn-dependent protease
MRQMMAQAFNDWQSSTNGLVSWRQVSNPMQADIVALWTADVQARSGGVEAGNTESLTSMDPYTRNGQIEAAKITILTGMGGRPFSDTEMRKTTLHEVGHSLGLEGHSRTRTDIMYPAVNATQTPYLQSRDVNTLARLYSGSASYGGNDMAPPAVAQYGGYGYGPAPTMASMPKSILGNLARQWIQQRLGY